MLLLYPNLFIFCYWSFTLYMSHNLVTAPALCNAYGLSFKATINEKINYDDYYEERYIPSGTYPVT